MKSLKYIKVLLDDFAKEINKSPDSEYRIKVESIFLENINKLIGKYPNLLYPICDVNIPIDVAQTMVLKIREIAQHNYIPIVPSNKKFIDVINESIIETPSFDNYFNDKKDIVLKECEINDYLIGLLLSLPINKIHITFVELGSNHIGDYFYKNINPKLYNVITSEHELNVFFEKKSKKILDFKKKYSQYPNYCQKNHSIPEAYEFIVFSDFNIYGTSWANKYISLVRNGVDAGIGIITMSQYAKQVIFDIPQIFEIGNQSKNVRDFIGEHNCDLNYVEYTINRNGYTTDDLNLCGIKPFEKQRFPLSDKRFSNKEWLEGWFTKRIVGKGEAIVKKVHVKGLESCKTDKLIKCNSLFDNKNLLKACLEYINNEADKKESIVIQQDFNKSVSNVYEKKFETITLPIGKSSDNEVNFTVDMVSHVHSFIIGQSGSGKSVFLHNIIGSAILKYAPEDLQLYLLDFKLGGVEFNRYKGIKHVKSLLVDNSDQQITLEILRELRERMVERGRQLRDCGVNNLVEYNKQNPNATMPQILVVVDECHEMFRVGSDIPRTVSNEISEIVTKIAKEGRNQGVHLILATQTLSGTEISNEILNNISDHYLLKCAPVDSERMVERSSEITSKLQTGQIYYHHVDNQVQFQAYYTDKENAEKLIELAKQKAQNYQSNGEFYFNGSQLFKLDETIMKQGKKRAKYPVAYMGKNISISQNDLSITLRKDYSENILLFGLNDVEQVTRTTMNLFISLISYTQSKGLDYKFKVFNCLSNEDSIYSEHLEMLEEEGYCEIIEGRKDRGKFLKQLSEDISNETAENTILLILGQERFRELKMDMEIAQEQSKPSEDDAFGFGGFSFSNEGTSSASVKTFKQALELILDKGPELGVHTIMQLDKPSNFLFSDYISPKLVYQKFKHLIMLKSDESASAQLHLNDNIRLETLSKDLERLRAYYYSEESDTYTLFTPYMELSNDEIMNLLKSE